MKRVRVQGFFPQVSSAHADQQSEGSGSTLSVAIGRAVDALLALPVVRGKRHQVLKLTVMVLE
jgi:hypothetical protein